MAEQAPANQSPVHELIARRRSTLAFSTRKVEPEKIVSLLEAARWAASSYNEQPWSFIVATHDDGEAYERLLSCLVEGNRVWAKNAPALVLSVAKLSFARNNHPNRHALYDVGQAVANLSIQATALGLVVHQMAGYDAECARREFSIPEGYEPAAFIAIGYQGEAESLPESLRARETAPRTRRPLEQFVFTNAWGETAPLVIRQD